jgi:hypothetical protein
VIYERLGILIGVLKEKTISTLLAPGLVTALVTFTEVNVVGTRSGKPVMLKNA